MSERETIAKAAAEAIEALRADDPRLRALVGFDGFIDVICTAVDQRRSMRMEDYAPFAGIGAFAGRVADAAGRSGNIELVVHEERFGGNGPLFAGGLASLGVGTTYVGCVGEETRGNRGGAKVHPLFVPFAARCERVVAVGPPARTECIEFADGKVMFNEAGAIQGVRWADVVRAVGLEELRRVVGRCSMVGTVNWSIMAGVEDIWEGLTRDVLTQVAGERRVYVDLSDPAKRTRGDIARCLKMLSAMNANCPVTLGLNLSEAEQVGAVLGVRAVVGDLAERCERLAVEIRRAMGIACVVVHPREGAAGATRDESAWFDGPFTPTPRLSTGAGDHFNAGVAFGQMVGLPLVQCLAVGTAVSGAYVRDGVSPSRERVVGFLRALPGA